MHHRIVVAVCCALSLLCVLPLFLLRAQTSLPDHPQPQELPDAPSSVQLPEHQKHPVPRATTGSEQPIDEAWPRKATRGDETITMYQPQIEGWNGDELRAYAAVALVSNRNTTTRYGVVWFTARTEVDKVNRQVTLNDFEITRVKFPRMETKEAEYQAFLQAKLP